MRRAVAACHIAALCCALLLFAAPLATRFGLVSYELGLPLTAASFLGAALLLPAALVSV